MLRGAPIGFAAQARQLAYANAKVDALINGYTSIDSSWTQGDFADLCVAAADQAGATRAAQTAIADQLPACAHPQCDQFDKHNGRHSLRCDDGSCCEPREVDAESVAAMREHHFGAAR